MTDNKKPFGLTLACKVASEAIRESVAPTSVVLYSLLVLQKDTSFPKNLDVQYFATQKQAANEQDKRVVAKILDQLRAPHMSSADLLEGFIKTDWVFKKAPAPIYAETKNKTQANGKKVAGKALPKKPFAKPQVKKEVVAPVVTIKKHKLI